MKQMTLKTKSNLSPESTGIRSSQNARRRLFVRLPLFFLVAGMGLQLSSASARQQEDSAKVSGPQESPFSSYGSFEKLLQVARQGNSDAQAAVSICYGKGDGVAQDYGKAFSWAMKSAGQGNALGASTVAGCYMQGKGVKEDIPRAVEWTRKAAELGDSKAQYNLASMYYDGFEGVPQELEKAFFWFEKAANQGNRDAQYYLGACYTLGTGVEKNIENALHWLEKAANQGHAEAQDNLAAIYLNDNDVLQGIREASDLLFEKTKERGQNTSEKNIETEVQRKIEKMAYWFQKAAQQGIARSQTNLGIFYATGLGGMKKDLAEAMKWWKKAADQGDAEAQYALGACYSGEIPSFKDIPQDIKEMRKWLQKAADQDNKKAKDALERLDQAKTSS